MQKGWREAVIMELVFLAMSIIVVGLIRVIPKNWNTNSFGMRISPSILQLIFDWKISVQLTPKIPWNQKLVVCCLGSLWVDFFSFLQFPSLHKWTTYFTSFPAIPSTFNSDSIWIHGEFLFKTSCKHNFLVFSMELLHAAMWLKLPRGWRAGCLKRSLFCSQNLRFSFFFQKLYLLMVLHDITFNVAASIWMCSFWYLSRNFISSIVLEFWGKTPFNKKNSSSLILTNLKLRFELCVPYLVQK
jgi:hypothetical protein